jgi:hypothetical protein
MQPEIIERKKQLLAGITNCGKDITAVDILGLWSIYDKSQAGIPNRIEGMWYELFQSKRSECVPVLSNIISSSVVL